METRSSPAFVQVFEGLSRMQGRLIRCLGSVDARGQGTHFPVADLGAFVLVEDARGLVGPGVPDFGAHPHAGLLAVSYFADGGPWRSRSNVPGVGDLRVPAGRVLLTLAGRGLWHDERTAGDGEHEILQIILRLPAAARGLAPGITEHTPREVDEGVRCLFEPGAHPAASVDASVFRVTRPSGKAGPTHVPVGPAQDRGFAYVRGGQARIGNTDLRAGQVAVFETRDPKLRIEGLDHAGGCDLIVGLSAPHAEPWVKRLGHEGFVVAGDIEAAEAKLADYAADPEGFGRA